MVAHKVANATTNNQNWVNNLQTTENGDMVLLSEKISARESYQLTGLWLPILSSKLLADQIEE